MPAECVRYNCDGRLLNAGIVGAFPFLRTTWIRATWRLGLIDGRTRELKFPTFFGVYQEKTHESNFVLYHVV